MGLTIKAKWKVFVASEPPEATEQDLTDGDRSVRELQPCLDEEPTREPPTRLLLRQRKPLVQEVLAKLGSGEPWAFEGPLWVVQRRALVLVHRGAVPLNPPVCPREHGLA